MKVFQYIFYKLVKVDVEQHLVLFTYLLNDNGSEIVKKLSQRSLCHLQDFTVKVLFVRNIS